MKTPLIFSFLLFTSCCLAQKREELFNHNFKPSKSGVYYYVTTEKNDTGWYREAFYISQRTLFMKGWYKDEQAKIKHGPFTYYHTTRFPSSEGRYVNDKKEGLWLGYDDKGVLIDSSTYSNGYLNGISLRWHSNGYPLDSLNFDGLGNGVQVSWYEDGSLSSAGRWIQDTTKNGRWKYYHRNGSTLAIEEYKNGKLITCTCYDETGMQLDSSFCKEKEAEPAGGKQGWKRFLENNLQSLIEAKARVLPAGEYTVLIRFIVEKDGQLSDFKPLTEYGQGLEDDLIRILKRAPKWTPGRQQGRAVRSYHTQPVSFMIQVQ